MMMSRMMMPRLRPHFCCGGVAGAIFKGQSPGLGAQVGRGDPEEEAGSANVTHCLMTAHSGSSPVVRVMSRVTWRELKTD
jgi:hypothetical protein